MFYAVKDLHKTKSYSPSNTRGVERHRYPISPNWQNINLLDTFPKR